MKVVIDIDVDVYKSIKEEVRSKINTFEHIPFLHGVISVGTVLPKNCGDLISKDTLLDELDKVVRTTYDDSKPPLSWDRAVAFVHLAPTIREADKDGRE